MRMVRVEGFEPPNLAAAGPKPAVSASSTTRASENPIEERDGIIKWITDICRKEIPEAGPWGIRVDPHVTVHFTGYTQVRGAVIKVWSVDRWVWWLCNDFEAIKWQYRQALMKRHYEDRKHTAKTVPESVPGVPDVCPNLWSPWGNFPTKSTKDQSRHGI